MRKSSSSSSSAGAEAASAADEALAPYHGKRDFAQTPEPRTGGKPGRGRLSFVVQKHHASQLHYDFRLELDGTLKSWAIPKGPCLDPAMKRMAVQVEDHPLSYASFEGTIPPQQYGAGTVIVWDRGEWQPDGDARAGLAAGKLKFELHGEKLRGHWTLVRMRGRGSEKQPAWLLIKENDEEARPATEFDVLEALPDSVLSGRVLQAAAPAAAAKKTAKTALKTAAKTAEKTAAKTAVKKAAAKTASAKTPAAQAPAAKKTSATRKASAASAPAPLPPTLSPQLATLVDAMPAAPQDWLYELKFDGYRLLARIEGDTVQCITRNGHDWTAKLPALAKALARLPTRSAWLDGEITVAGENGAPDFQRLQNAFEQGATASIVYWLFDAPFLDGVDLRAQPVEQRRALLARLIGAKATGMLRLSETFDARPEELLASSARLGFEGIIAKRKGSPYVPRRSPDWIKLKNQRRQEFVIGGYTAPQGARVGFGALLLGVHDADGRLRYCGNVGTGFDTARLRAMKAQFDRLASAQCPFEPAPRGVKAQWVRPTLVAEVAFGEWTRDGRVRHAVFQGLRADKPAAQIVREEPAAAAKGTTNTTASTSTTNSSTTNSSTTKKRKAASAMKPQRITHAERVIDAQSGTTKGELAAYYEAVSELILPHLRGRPVALVRAPDGVGGELFFQKHSLNSEMPGVRLLDPALDPGHDPLLQIDSAQGLLSAAQMNVIELHTWNASSRAIGQPDRMSFDLDPGEGVEWQRMLDAAFLVRTLLTELALPSFLKTSGGKGLHVVVPLRRQYGWDQVKGFSQAIVQHLAAAIPERFVAKSGPRNRVGKIFVDYLRNGFGATTVSAWSARSRPGLGISVPLDWDELPELKSASQWTVANAAERLPIGNQPWAEMERSRTGLRAAMAALGYEPAA